tara:strand:- start:5 stop:643 length:639 start_codon:yes stop_codon:yes gene_type:complete
MSVPFDPTKTEYEMFIDISYNHVINQNKIHCVTKDKLLEGLTAINNIENANLYNYYIIGKLNSSCPFPTWDIDMILTSDTVNETQLLDTMKNIKEMGFAKNLNFDLKYMTDIEIMNVGYRSPDISFNIIEKKLLYDLSLNQYNFYNNNKEHKINNSYTKAYPDLRYYEALLIKQKGENTLTDLGIQFINNSILPNSSLMNSGKYEKYSFRSD